MLDAVLTGAKGLNLWSSFRVPAAAAKRAPVSSAGRDAASRRRCPAALLPTEIRFSTRCRLTATDGTPLGAVGGGAAGRARTACAAKASREAELRKAKAQLRARLVFDNDSVTNVAHQLGYFETVAGPSFLAEILARIEGGDCRRSVARSRATASEIPDDRLVPADRTDGMSATLTRGLSPVRIGLSNGTVVIVQQTTIAPAVTINAAFRAGSVYDPADQPGLAFLTGRLVDRGTEHRTADVIAEELDDLGIALRLTTHVTC